MSCAHDLANTEPRASPLTGRWNHNPNRVTTLVQLFNEADVNVQLKHIATETSWEDDVDHGYIAVVSADGKQILRKDGFQHNRKMRDGGARDHSAMQAIVEEVTTSLAAAVKTEAAAA